MLTTDVKTAFKIADVKFINNSTKLDFVYLTNIKDENNNPLPKDILTNCNNYVLKRYLVNFYLFLFFLFHFNP